MATTETIEGRRGGVWRVIRVLFKLGFWGAVLLLLVILFCNLWVVGSTSNQVFTEVSELEANDVAVVLGTAKNVAPQRPNLHFKSRMEAAAELFKEGKVKHLLVSGSNPTKYYNEPRDMEEALLKLGVPKSAITRDYAGRRTFDSVVRAGKVFGLEKVTIVSDGFHVPRAVFLARESGLEAVALAGGDVDFKLSWKSRVREWLARVKAVMDVYLLDTEPKFLGEPERIRIGEGDGGGDGDREKTAD